MVRLDLIVEGTFEYIDLMKISGPVSPSAGYGRLYYDNDNNVYLKQSNGDIISISSANITYSNAGTAGVGIVLTKNVGDLPFKAINGIGAISAANNGTDKTVEISIADATDNTKGAVMLSTSMQSSAGRVVQANDTRLTDSRNPTVHTHVANDLPNVTGLNGYPGGSTNFLRADGTFATPAGGGDVTLTGTQTLTNKTVTAPLLDTFYDMTRISAPADPSANMGRFYVKQIDSNNDGVFVKVKVNGAYVERQIA